MYTILIVDDDQAIREGFCLMLGDIEPSARLLTAQTGAEALGIVMQHSVELIFTDVKMPVMDGLELTENLRLLKYQGEVVIISGHDDFELVRKALQLGATDYLLKPVKQDELRSVCTTYAARFKSKQFRDLSLGLKEAHQNAHLQQVWLNKLMEGGEEAKHVWDGFGNLPSHLFCLVLDLYSAGYSDADKILLSLSDVLTKELPSRGCNKPVLIHGEHTGHWLVLVFIDSQFGNQLRSLCAQELFSKGFRCGISSIYLTHELHNAYWEAHEALNETFYDIPLPEEELKEAFPYPQLTDTVLSCAKDGNSPSYNKAMEALFSQARIERPDIGMLRQHLRTIVYSMMNQNKDLIGIIGKYKLTKHDVIQQIRELQTFSMLRRSFIDIMLMYLGEMTERRLASEDSYIQKAKSYIDHHYGESMSLGEVSSVLGLNPNYFSSLFHQKTGETFTEYIRSVRIANAILLMGSTNMKVYEIAQRTGFSDNAQFFRAFKQVTGISPGKYKQQHTDRR